MFELASSKTIRRHEPSTGRYPALAQMCGGSTQRVPTEAQHEQWYALPGHLALFNRNAEEAPLIFKQSDSPESAPRISDTHARAFGLNAQRLLCFHHAEHGSVVVDLESSRVFSLNESGALSLRSDPHGHRLFDTPEIRHLKITEIAAPSEGGRSTHSLLPLSPKASAAVAAVLLVGAFTGIAILSQPKGKNSQNQRGSDASDTPTAVTTSPNDTADAGAPAASTPAATVTPPPSDTPSSSEALASSETLASSDGQAPSSQPAPSSTDLPGVDQQAESANPSEAVTVPSGENPTVLGDAVPPQFPESHSSPASSEAPHPLRVEVPELAPQSAATPNTNEASRDPEWSAPLVTPGNGVTSGETPDEPAASTPSIPVPVVTAPPTESLEPPAIEAPTVDAPQIQEPSPSTAPAMQPSATPTPSRPIEIPSEAAPLGPGAPLSQPSPSGLGVSLDSDLSELLSPLLSPPTLESAPCATTGSEGITSNPVSPSVESGSVSSPRGGDGPPINSSPETGSSIAVPLPDWVNQLWEDTTPSSTTPSSTTPSATESPQSVSPETAQPTVESREPSAASGARGALFEGWANPSQLSAADLGVRLPPWASQLFDETSTTTLAQVPENQGQSANRHTGTSQLNRSPRPDHAFSFEQFSFPASFGYRPSESKHDEKLVLSK